MLKIPFRLGDIESKAPAFISDSMILLEQTCDSIFSRKSAKVSNLPFSDRVLRTDSTTPIPIFLMADNPKRILPSLGANSALEKLTSGGSTKIPIRRHSFK